MKRFSILLYIILISLIASLVYSASPATSPSVSLPEPLPDASPGQTQFPASQNGLNSPVNTLMAVGDISFSGIDGMILKNPEYPWVDIKEVMNTANILMANQEIPLSNRGAIYTEKKWKLRANPKTVQSLVNAGFDIVTLANNHILDYGPIAMQDTLDALNQAGIAHTGAGGNLSEARQPAIITASDGTKFAFLAYSLVYPDLFWASNTRPGAPCGDPSYFVPDIKKAKAMADFVIVSFHWSNELIFYPRDYQKVYGKKCIDAGASIVIGHHPHVLQGFEVYKGGLIAYSLGNFVFGSRSAKLKDSIILALEYDKDGFTQAKLYPLNVNNLEVEFQPRFRHGADAERVLQDLRVYSKGFHTKIASEGEIGVIKIRDMQAK